LASTKLASTKLAPPLEIYLNDPGKTPADQLVTEQVPPIEG